MTNAPHRRPSAPASPWDIPNGWWARLARWVRWLVRGGNVPPEDMARALDIDRQNRSQS